MNLLHEKISENKGFTLIEVIAVLIILGILTAVVISRTTSTGAYSVVSEAEILKSHLRIAQLRAMGDVNDNPVNDNKWGINVGSGSYTLICSGTCPAPIPNLLGESSATHVFSGVSATPQTIIFDKWGSPDISPTITLTSGSDHAGITITANTGFIQ